jgi:transcriptional regulator with XRE-family HTH domain
MTLNDNILSFIKQTPNAVQTGIAERVKLRRLESALTQKELAARAGIPLPTFRRFERTGEISLRALIMLGFALGMTIDEWQLAISL